MKINIIIIPSSLSYESTSPEFTPLTSFSNTLRPFSNNDLLDSTSQVYFPSQPPSDIDVNQAPRFAPNVTRQQELKFVKEWIYGVNQKVKCYGDLDFCNNMCIIHDINSWF